MADHYNPDSDPRSAREVLASYVPTASEPARTGPPKPTVEARNRKCRTCGGLNGAHVTLRCAGLKDDFKAARSR